MSSKTNIKPFIYSIALLASLADSLLVPFYPQFFNSVYKEDTLSVTGIYIAACRLAMMCSFPFWSWLSKKYNVIKILSVTQILAAAVCISSAFAADLKSFFVLTLLAELLKSSYLLLYPYLIKISGHRKRSTVISYIALILNSGIVISAVAGGYIIENMNPAHALIVVGILDVCQFIICCYVLSLKGFKAAVTEQHKEAETQPTQEFGLSTRRDFVLICAITWVFYFSMVIIRPYFTQFIIGRSGEGFGLTEAGMIFIIPNILALFMVPFTAYVTSAPHIKRNLLLSAGFILAGIIFQLFYTTTVLLIAGRVIYSIGIFISEVSIDLMVFSLCSSADLFRYYSYISVVQNIAIFSAPLCAGLLITTFGHEALFFTALAGTAFVVFLLLLLWKKQVLREDKDPNLNDASILQVTN